MQKKLQRVKYLRYPLLKKRIWKRESPMKKTRSLTRILNFLAFIAAVVSFFCNFAPSFSADGYYDRGNCFQAIYAQEGGNFRTVVIPLVIAMVLVGLLMIVTLIGTIFGEKGSKIIGLTELVLGVAGGVMYLLAGTFYVSANGITNLEVALGPGPICVSVFAFLAALLGLISIAFGKKKIAVE